MTFLLGVHFGTDQADSRTGGSGRDWIWGEAGDDYVLLAGAGDDFIYGGAGEDHIIGAGGAGADIFEFRFQSPRGMGTDIITDFKDGEDLIYINTNETLLTDTQKKALRDGIVYEGPSTGYTGATIDLSDADSTGLSGVVHIVFDGTTTGLDADDFIWIDYFWSS